MAWTKKQVKDYRKKLMIWLEGKSSWRICKIVFDVRSFKNIAFSPFFVFVSNSWIRKDHSHNTTTKHRGYFNHSHRGSGSTPSNSYFLPPGVLPVLLYHFCGSTSYEYSQWLFFNSLGVVPQVLYHFCGSTPTKVV